MCEALCFGDTLVCPYIGCDGEMLAGKVTGTDDRPGLAFLKCSDCGCETDHVQIEPTPATTLAGAR